MFDQQHLLSFQLGTKRVQQQLSPYLALTRIQSSIT
ncbi:hypothetical protein CCICO_01650 [Corynebacterium ciconiae DSM 44920]|nr:hypothetical protein CCICO_01650 [Corynebacterium ciconiae DSM 44920]